MSIFYFFFSLIITLQTVYPNSEVLRLFHRNVTGYCLFAFHSDKASISRLGKKLFPTNSKWFLNAYDHATQTTRNGFLYIDTSNESGLREKFRIRNFLAPIYAKTTEQDPSLQEGTRQDLAELTDANTRSYQQQSIRAIAKKDHQYLYADLTTESPTF